MAIGNNEPGPKSTLSWDTLEEFIRGQVQKLIQDVIDEEVEQFLGRSRYERTGGGADGGVKKGYRNGHGPPRKLGLMGGTIKVRRPKLRGLEEKFESRILPRFKRKSEAVGNMLPELYLHGLSLGDFELALRGLLGDGAPLSASSIDRLRRKWQAEYGAWRRSRLDSFKLVYLWADGIYVKAGLEKEKACLLVVIGADVDGRKAVLAVDSGYRESTESWSEVLRDLKSRGLRPPTLTVADGHLGIWAALSQVYPESREQRCWNHKIRNVLDCLPKKHHRPAKEMLRSMFFSKTRNACETVRKEFGKSFGNAFPRAVEKLERDWERMVSFFDFPFEHWQHLRTTNIVESPFAAVRLRTTAAKRFKKVGNATAIIWKILMLQERSFRKLRGWKKLRDVYDGVAFSNGKKIKTAA